MSGIKHDAGKLQWQLMPPEMGFSDSAPGDIEDRLCEWYHHGGTVDELVEIYKDLEAIVSADGDKFFGAECITKVLAFGAEKYEPHNWENGLLYSRCIGATMRHLISHERGETLDLETGFPHLWHALCEIGFLVTFERRGMGVDWDDRPNCDYGPVAEPCPEDCEACECVDVDGASDGSGWIIYDSGETPWKFGGRSGCGSNAINWDKVNINDVVPFDLYGDADLALDNFLRLSPSYSARLQVLTVDEARRISAPEQEATAEPTPEIAGYRLYDTVDPDSPYGYVGSEGWAHWPEGDDTGTLFDTYEDAASTLEFLQLKDPAYWRRHAVIVEAVKAYSADAISPRGWVIYDRSDAEMPYGTVTMSGGLHWSSMTDVEYCNHPYPTREAALAALDGCSYVNKVLATVKPVY